MLVESHYFNDGALRASWVFASPNQFGAFVATCLPVVWAVQHLVRKRGDGGREDGRPRARSSLIPRNWMVLFGGSVALELWVWFLLAKSGSRGAAVAALSAACWWTFSSLFGPERKGFRIGGWLGVRFVACVVGLMMASAAGRFAPDYVAQDRSIGNRTILWSGGAQLMLAAPWRG